jgi:hypothetical protein
MVEPSQQSFNWNVSAVASRDVEVGDLVIVEDVPHRWLLEGVLIVEDVLLQGVDSVFILFGGDGHFSFLVGNGLEKPVGDLVEKGCVDVVVDLECRHHWSG